MLKKLIYFFQHGIWHKDDVAEAGKEKWYVRAAKIAVYTVKGLTEHDVGVRAAALTFFTLMSIVPVAALIFGVIKGFGLEGSLTDYLYDNFGQYREAIDYVLQFADNMLSRVRGGVVAIVGFAVLLWSVVQVFGNIENAFNNIWEVRKQRSLARKFSDYVAVVFVAPILWLISNSLLSTMRQSIESVSGSSLFAEILFGLISLAAIWLMFAFIYYVMPNTKVKFKGALIAGIIAGTLFQIFQVGYFFIQGYLNTYNIIYGSFAALPLFLIFLQWSWMILLVGAELSFAYQNIRAYEQERESLHMCYDRRRKVMLATLIVIAEHFVKKEGPVSSGQISAQIGMPVRIVRDVLFDLEQAGLIVTVQNDKDDMINLYSPARDMSDTTIADVLEGVECSRKVPEGIVFEGSEMLEKVNEVMDRMKAHNRESADNVKITDLIGYCSNGTDGDRG